MTRNFLSVAFIHDIEYYYLDVLFSDLYESFFKELSENKFKKILSFFSFFFFKIYFSEFLKDKIKKDKPKKILEKCNLKVLLYQEDVAGYFSMKEEELISSFLSSNFIEKDFIKNQFKQKRKLKYINFFHKNLVLFSSSIFILFMVLIPFLFAPNVSHHSVVERVMGWIKFLTFRL